MLLTVDSVLTARAIMVWSHHYSFHAGSVLSMSKVKGFQQDKVVAVAERELLL